MTFDSRATTGSPSASAADTSSVRTRGTERCPRAGAGTGTGRVTGWSTGWVTGRVMRGLLPEPSGAAGASVVGRLAEQVLAADDLRHVDPLVPRLLLDRFDG